MSGRRTRTRVLVVHRQRALVQRLRAQFESLDNIELSFENSADALAAEQPQAMPDVIVLDLALLTPPGFRVHRVLQPHSALAAPVAILRACVDERTTHRRLERWRSTDGIEALEAQIQLALGRKARCRSWLPLCFAGVHLVADLPNAHVVVDGRSVPISAREGEVLGYLLAHRNRLVPRDVLVSEIWGYDTRSLDAHVSRLRQKLGPASTQLETVKQFGYRFLEPDAAPAAARGEHKRVCSEETTSSPSVYTD